MNVTFACPHCRQTARVALSAELAEFLCPHCEAAIRIPAGAIDEGRVTRCLVCPSTDLYVRKDFPQRLGVGLVVIGVIGSSIAWAYTMVELTFAILFATALADVALYWIVGQTLACYRCGAEYRDVAGLERQAPFDLEIHERHRQIAARSAQPRAEAPSRE